MYLFLHRFLYDCGMLVWRGMKLSYGLSRIKSSAEKSNLVNHFLGKPQDRRQNSGAVTSNRLHRVSIIDNSWLSNQVSWTFKLIKQLQTGFFTVSTLNVECPFQISLNISFRVVSGNFTIRKANFGLCCTLEKCAQNTVLNTTFFSFVPLFAGQNLSSSLKLTLF